MAFANPDDARGQSSSRQALDAEEAARIVSLALAAPQEATGAASPEGLLASEAVEPHERDWTGMELFTRYHWQLFVLCGVAWGFAAAWFTALQFLLPDVAGEWGLPRQADGAYATMLYTGVAMGALAFGRLSDLRGRRPTLLVAMWLSSIAAVASTLALGWPWVMMCQFSIGIGIGGTLPLANVLFGEWCPTHIRGRYMTLLGGILPLLNMVVVALAWLSETLLKRNPHAEWKPWQALYIAYGSLQGCWALLLVALLPESPRFLQVRGRCDEAAALIYQKLGCVATPNLPSPSERNAEANSSCNQGASESERSGTALLRALLGSDRGRTTSMLWVIWFGTTFGVQGFNIFLPQFLKSKHIKQESVYQDCLVFAAAGLPGVFCASYWIEGRLGRRKTIWVTLAITALSIGLFASANAQWQSVLCACIFNAASNAVWVAIYTYTPEAYSTEARSQGVGAASAFHSFAGMLTPIYGGWFVQSSQPVLALVGFMVPVAVGAVAAKCLPKETRDVPL